jgi:hypothetical protein
LTSSHHKNWHLTSHNMTQFHLNNNIATTTPTSTSPHLIDNSSHAPHHLSLTNTSLHNCSSTPLRCQQQHSLKKTYITSTPTTLHNDQVQQVISRLNGVKSWDQFFATLRFYGIWKPHFLVHEKFYDEPLQILSY